MTDLKAAVDSYLALRCGLGFTLQDHRRVLPDFVDYLDHHGAEHISTELALAWPARERLAGVVATAPEHRARVRAISAHH